MDEIQSSSLRPLRLCGLASFLVCRVQVRTAIKDGVVASANRYATQADIEILRAGGNAIDAAITGVFYCQRNG